MKNDFISDLSAGRHIERNVQSGGLARDALLFRMAVVTTATETVHQRPTYGVSQELKVESANLQVTPQNRAYLGAEPQVEVKANFNPNPETAIQAETKPQPTSAENVVDTAGRSPAQNTEAQDQARLAQIARADIEDIYGKTA